MNYNRSTASQFGWHGTHVLSRMIPVRGASGYHGRDGHALDASRSRAGANDASATGTAVHLAAARAISLADAAARRYARGIRFRLVAQHRPAPTSGRRGIADPGGARLVRFSSRSKFARPAA